MTYELNNECPVLSFRLDSERADKRAISAPQSGVSWRMRIHTVLRVCAIFPLVLLPMSRQALCQTKKGCDKPPQLVFQPHLSPEDVGRIKSSKLAGTVAVIISEDGSVAAAKVLSADPKEGAQVLYDAVLLAKFKERPGCGRLRIDFIFKLSLR